MSVRSTGDDSSAPGYARKNGGGWSRKEHAGERPNVVRTFWDSDYKIIRDASTGKIADVYFLRRYCSNCHSPIEHNDDELPECPVCGRIFSMARENWPFYSKRIR